jgi:hypothetical protein
LRLELEGVECNRDAIGASVEVKVGSSVQRRTVNPTRSYLSQVELPLTFGLDQAEKVDHLSVTWPHGETQEFSNLAADTTYRLREGEAIKSVDIGSSAD